MTPRLSWNRHSHQTWDAALKNPPPGALPDRRFKGPHPLAAFDASDAVAALSSYRTLEVKHYEAIVAAHPNDSEYENGPAATRGALDLVIDLVTLMITRVSVFKPL